jgi:hypothetical protein
MALRLRVKYTPAAWFKALTQEQGAVANAAVAALNEIAAASVAEGRLNIAGSGKFGPKWIEGLQYRIVDPATKGSSELEKVFAEAGTPVNASLKAKAVIFHKFGIAGVFEHGATIEGKPLLWIPTDPGAPPAGRSGKKLVSATVRGQPVLFDAADHTRDRKPLYVGVPSVRIPKKWRITEIVKANVKKFSALFLKHFKVQ